jgi:hypothetical protein
MDRHAMGTLTQFCASQREGFDARAWLKEGAANPKAYAVAAKYLSMTSWYGHDEELERIATRLYPTLAVRDGFDREMQSVGLDLPFFSSSVRYHIALRDIERRLNPVDALAAEGQTISDTSER